MSHILKTLDELRRALREARDLEEDLKCGEESIRELRLGTYDSMQDLVNRLLSFGLSSDLRRVRVFYQELRNAFPGICQIAELRLATERRQVGEHRRQLEAMLKQVEEAIEEVMAGTSLETEEEKA